MHYLFRMVGGILMSSRKIFLTQRNAFLYLNSIGYITFCLFVLSTVLISNAAIIDDARKCWEKEFAFIQKKLPSSIDQSKVDREYVANENALLLSSDRDPLDVIIRRTDALCASIQDLSNAPSMVRPTKDCCTTSSCKVPYTNKSTIQ